MSTHTPNIGMTLPTGTENVSRQIINGNFTLIDNYYGALNNQISTLVKQQTVTGTTDAKGNLTTNILLSTNKILSTIPNRTDSNYYTSYYTAIPASDNQSKLIIRCKDLNSDDLATTNVKITVTYV